MSDSPEHVVLHRSRWMRALWLAIGLVAVILCASGIAYSWGSTANNPPPASPAQRAIFSALTLLAVVGTVRAWRLAIVLTSGKVIVRNLRRTVRLERSEVIAVQPPAGYGTLRHAGLRLHTREGKIVSATAFTNGPFDTGRTGTNAAAKLAENLGCQLIDRPPRSPSSGLVTAAGRNGQPKQ